MLLRPSLAAFRTRWAASITVRAFALGASEGDLSTVSAVRHRIALSLGNAQARMETQGDEARWQTLCKEMEREDLWDDAARANVLSREHARLNSRFELLTELRSSSDEQWELAELAFGDDDPESASIVEECVATMADLERRAKRLEMETLLSGEADHLGCFVEVRSGMGGGDACDFTAMLIRMYRLWAERAGFTAEVTEQTPSPDAPGGLKGGVLRIAGENAFGWMRCEVGTHRKVGISQHDTQKRRQTAFAQVFVLPDVDPGGTGGDIEVELQTSDLKIETYRSSGAGGQHVNTTDSAVRVTHLPTGLVAQSQDCRSQHQNKATALALLKARIVEQKMREETEKREAAKSEMGSITWGSQIRSYVLFPYTLVKDHRTGHENSRADAVLDGVELSGFMESVLRGDKHGANTEGSGEM